jgi:hypothetical protein
MERIERASSLHWSKAIVAIAMVVSIAGLGCFVLFERREDMDLNSGRLRFQATLGPIVLSEDVRDSSFSKWFGESSDISGKAQWGHILVSGVFREHGRYGSALAELERFVIVCKKSQIDRDKQVALGRQLLTLLRDERFEEAEKLIDNLEDNRTVKAGR